MAPRKRKAAAALAGSLDEVSAIQKELCEWITDQYNHMMNSHSGSFLDMVRDAWRSDEIVGKVLNLVKVVGVCAPDMTVDSFYATWLTATWPPPSGRMLTSILMWSFDSASLWKGEVPMSDLLPLAKGMAMQRFREVSPIHVALAASN